MGSKLARTPGIYLTGFMGSGKTTVGQLLADELGWPFVDLDDDIEAIAGSTITEVFASKGEVEFRRIEHDALKARVHQVLCGRPVVGDQRSRRERAAALNVSASGFMQKAAHKC